MAARMLALVSDCYGMGGGIARYNQDLFEGLAEEGAEIVVLPRHGKIVQKPRLVVELGCHAGNRRGKTRGA